MQKGEGRLGCIFWVLVAAIATLVAIKAVPVKLASSQLYDHMVELAKFSANLPAERLERSILQRAQELDIPLSKKGVSVRKQMERVRMRVRYSVPLEFPGYTYTWDFDQEVDRPIFYW